jgi:hypothetical protein
MSFLAFAGDRRVAEVCRESYLPSFLIAFPASFIFSPVFLAASFAASAALSVAFFTHVRSPFSPDVKQGPIDEGTIDLR